MRQNQTRVPVLLLCSRTFPALCYGTSFNRVQDVANPWILVSSWSVCAPFRMVSHVCEGLNRFSQACSDYFPLDSGLFSLGLSRCLTPLLGARPARSELITSSESMIAAEIADGGKRQRTIPTDKVTTMSVISSKLVSRLCIQLTTPL